ncbi:DUF4350 domain-containing protein [Streptomyces sp. NPDC058662]|uniref:DUF4350 domain-containing protein n=1 Tax=Streptomyces sp. NPDC058662 TaxID=3346583 RepID=UPI00364DE526
MTGPTPPAPGPFDTSPTAPAAPAPAPAAAEPPAPAPRPRRAPALRRARTVLVLTALLVAGGVAMAVLNSGTRHGYLDPRSADPFGSRAVAELLKERGVTTRVVTTAREAAAAAGPGTTLLVTDPDRLGATQQRAVRTAADLSGGRTVLLAPGGPSLPGLAPDVHTQGTAHTDVLSPDCALPAATSAGRAGTGTGPRYTTTRTAATACYPSDGRPTLLVLPSGTTGGDTVVLGAESILLNENLADEGNASLALQLLGSRPDLVWYMPSLADSEPGTAPGEEKSLLDLIPAGWSWALLQLLVAAVLAALWRARRLGPLVTEKLPVVIRASEATEGRARLYRKAGARDRAATVLRAAARERLAALVGVPHARAHDPHALVPAVSARLTDGTRDAHTLLFGTTPPDDAALVALADHLDALEREVRTS